MICYNKLFELMKAQGKNKTHIRAEKVISQDTLGKLVRGTGILEDGRNPNSFEKDENGKLVLDENGEPIRLKATKTRINSVDSKSIEALCTWLNCQPGDIMEYIPNTWENADRLIAALKIKTDNKELVDIYKELSEKLPMEGNPLETE